MNGKQKQACIFGVLLLGFYAVYTISNPGGDGYVLSMFIGALTAFGGFVLGKGEVLPSQDK